MKAPTRGYGLSSAWGQRRALHAVGEQLRNVMRHIPQPVAIVVTRLEDGTHHGATLSSFTSISLSPPLVSFSLRLPSRLASALQRYPPNPQTIPIQSPSSSPRTDTGQVFSVSLLAKHHETLAHTFSQARAEHENMIQDTTQWETTRLGLPIVKNGLGALKCRVVGWVPLSGLGETIVGKINPNVPEEAKAEQPGMPEEGSVLFIARVEDIAIRDERKEPREKQEERIKPLVYENQRYVTTEV